MKIHNQSLSCYEEEVMHASCKIRGGLTRSLKTFEHIAQIDEENKIKFSDTRLNNTSIILFWEHKLLFQVVSKILELR
jgi:hypothetical protein